MSDDLVKEFSIKMTAKKVYESEKSIENEFEDLYNSDSEDDLKDSYAEEVLEKAFKKNPKNPKGSVLKKLVYATYWDETSILTWWIKKSCTIE